MLEYLYQASPLYYFLISLNRDNHDGKCCCPPNMTRRVNPSSTVIFLAILDGLDNGTKALYWRDYNAEIKIYNTSLQRAVLNDSLF